MKVFTTSQVREIDAYTIANEPVASIDLMERAAKAFADKFCVFFNNSCSVKVFAEPGITVETPWLLPESLMKINSGSGYIL